MSTRLDVYALWHLNQNHEASIRKKTMARMIRWSKRVRKIQHWPDIPGREGNPRLMIKDMRERLDRLEGELDREEDIFGPEF